MSRFSFARAQSAVLALTLAAVAGAAGADALRLKTGAVVEGTVVKRNEKRVWLDVGPEIVAFSVDDIEEVEISDAGQVAQVSRESLYVTATDLPQLSPKEQAKRVGPAVVKISTPSGLGSGVIINPEGFAITNAHVIQGERMLRATVWLPQSDGTLRRIVVRDVEIMAVNNHLDLALVRISHPNGESFDFAPLEAEEIIEVGQSVFAIGNPLGLERTLSQGVVSTKQRSFDGLSYIQTDAAINPGNSGGPLFNTKGEVVGITNMGILGGEALGFAIPARYVKDFIRNREAFAFDKDNPNSGHLYHPPPPRTQFGVAPALEDGSSRQDAPR
ncbi:MAG: S1C family serine protease [Planctomycetota bacterium]|jgi:serine protease Do